MRSGNGLGDDQMSKDDNNSRTGRELFKSRSKRSALLVVRQAMRRAVRMLIRALLVASLLSLWALLLIAYGPATLELILNNWRAELVALLSLMFVLLVWITISSLKDACKLQEPGAHVLPLARMFFCAETVDEVFGQAVNDMRLEYVECMMMGDRAGAFRAVFVHRLGILSAFVLLTVFTIVRLLVRVVARRPL